jgi:hypothetical protein
MEIENKIIIISALDLKTSDLVNPAYRETITQFCIKEGFSLVRNEGTVTYSEPGKVERRISNTCLW